MRERPPLSRQTKSEAPLSHTHPGAPPLTRATACRAAARPQFPPRNRASAPRPPPRPASTARRPHPNAVLGSSCATAARDSETARQPHRPRIPRGLIHIPHGPRSRSEPCRALPGAAASWDLRVSQRGSRDGTLSLFWLFHLPSPPLAIRGPAVALPSPLPAHDTADPFSPADGEGSVQRLATSGFSSNPRASRALYRSLRSLTLWGFFFCGSSLERVGRQAGGRAGTRMRSIHTHTHTRTITISKPRTPSSPPRISQDICSRIGSTHRPFFPRNFVAGAHGLASQSSLSPRLRKTTMRPRAHPSGPSRCHAPLRRRRAHSEPPPPPP